MNGQSPEPGFEKSGVLNNYEVKMIIQGPIQEP